MKKITILITLFFAQILHAQIHVDHSVIGGNNDGSSWSDAFISIQAAVNSASDNDTILIAQGTYLEGSEITINKPLTLKGGYPTGGGSQDIANNPTLIDGGNVHRVLRSTHNTGTLSLEGLTFQNGRSGGSGAGIQTEGDLNLYKVNVKDNAAVSSSSITDSAFGGGVFTNFAAINIASSVISGNSVSSTITSASNSSSNFSLAQGGGIYSFSGEITITDSLITSNVASSTGRDSSARGGGIASSSLNVTITNSYILNNSVQSTALTHLSADSRSFGGGAEFVNVTFINSVVFNNTSISTAESTTHNFSAGAGSSGGGVYASGTAKFINSIVSRNLVNATATATFSGASSRGGGVYGDTVLENSILWNNIFIRAGFFNEHEVGSLTTSHSMVRGLNLSGANGINALAGGFDPKFTNAGTGDFRLLQGSPLINAGNNSFISLVTDLDGNARLSDLIVDIGTFETQKANIGVALDVSVSKFQITFDYFIENLSSLDLSNISLDHDLDAVFGAGNYSINSSSSFVDDPLTINLNTNYDGSSNTSIVEANSTLAGLDTAQIRLIVDVITSINFGHYETQASINAEDMDMNMVSDLSDFSQEPDLTGNNFAGDEEENDITTFNITTAPPTFDMKFTPDDIVVNNLTKVQYTIDNSLGTKWRNLAFSQILPSGLKVSDPANIVNNCEGQFFAIESFISLTNGSVNPENICTVTFDLVASQAGEFNTNTFELTSDAGNSGIASATLNVDGIPVVTAPENITTEATANLTPVDIGTASAVDEDKLPPVLADNIGPYPVGETQVTWSVADSNGSVGSAIQTITITDTTAPTVSVPANINTEATANLTPVDIGTATATDLVDGMLTPTADNTGPYSVGVTQVTWSVADNSGTVGTAIQTITITDTTAPTIALNGNATTNLTVGDAYTDAGAIATDLVDGDLTTSIMMTGSVDTNTANTYTINFNVTDTAGNDAQQVSRTVIVSEAPTYFVGGTVDGLFDGNFFVLKLNNAEEKIISQNGGYIFNTPLIEDDTYSVTMDLDPNNPIQPCDLSDEDGTINTEDIMNVDVLCTEGDDLILRNGFELP